MDGDPVTGEPSEDHESKSLAEIFADAFPYYLAMGMTYDEFWRGSPTLVRDYRKAFDIKRHNEEVGRWRQGLYFYTALLRVAPVLRPFTKGKVEPGEYPSEPFPLTNREAREREEARENDRYERYIAQMKADSERELKRRREAQKKQEVNGNGDD